MPLTLRSVPAARGFAWLRLAFRLFFKRALPFTGMFAAFFVVAVVAMAIPFFGTLAVMMAAPLLSLGFMVATRSALDDGPVHPGQFIEPFRGPANPAKRHLAQLCMAYALGLLLVISLAVMVGGERFERLLELVTSPDQPIDELQALWAEPAVAYAVLAFGLGAVLLSVPFWHAPALVLWGGQSMAQALFSSTLALWRTKGAMLAYGLGWLAVNAAFGIGVGSLFALLGQRELAGVLAIPAGLLFTCVFYVSLYFTFDDSFGAAPPTTSEPASKAPTLPGDPPLS
jgi:hypothetical protein